MSWIIVTVAIFVAVALMAARAYRFGSGLSAELASKYTKMAKENVLGRDAMKEKMKIVYDRIYRVASSGKNNVLFNLTIEGCADIYLVSDAIKRKLTDQGYDASVISNEYSRKITLDIRWV